MSMDIYGQIYEGWGEASSIGLSFTRQAFQMLPELDHPRILDIGCGQGRATLELARLSGGQEDFWWLNFYALVEERIREMRQTYAGDQAAQKVLDQEQREVDLYRAHRQWYGSAFLVMQKSREPASPAGDLG